MKFNKLFPTVVITVFLGISAFSQNLNVTLRGQLTYSGQSLANICGYVDSLGNEYALVGASVGLSIVDITNPAAPVQVYQHTGPTGNSSKWQEIKVLGKYAYVTTEAGGGLQIFNLRSLPNVAGITVKSWTGDGAISGLLTSIHALHIDESKKFVYLFGSTLFSGGAVIADLADPWNPVYVGKYSVGAGNAAYVHDGYARNDTLYAGHIYSGYFSIVDCSNKANPVELATQFTPNKFTHNTWLSTNSKILFTTDEKENTFVTSYDVSDVANITELDKVQSNPGSNSGVHNTHIIRVAGNDYAVTSWYKDGFTIVDAGRPQNLVQVGNYDTYPAGSGAGFVGDWGVYPFFPSGTIVASNIGEGLFVFTPTYVRACYLEGAVTDSICGAQLNNVHITVTAAKINDSTDIGGQYKTGTALPGTYNVTFSRSGYVSKTITGVVLARGVVTNLSVQLKPFNTVPVNGLTTDASANPLAGVKVLITDAANSYDFTSNGSGNFSSCTVVSATDYNIYAGKWGYQTSCAGNQTINSGNGNLTFSLNKGYYDDFTLDFGWTVSSTASTGIWERGVPLATTFSVTPANPGNDVSTDCSDKAYITGNTGVTSSDDDVDNGATILTSPVFDLSTYTDPYLDYYRWFFNTGGSGTPNDSLVITLDNGSVTAAVEVVTSATANSSSWVHKSYKVSNFITPTATMKLIVRATDATPGHLVEAGFDKFLISEGPTGIEEQDQNNSSIAVYPNPFTEQTSIEYSLKNNLTSSATIVIMDVTGRVVEKVTLTHAKGVLTLKPTIDEGVYFVRLINGNEITGALKIIKVK